MGLARVLEGETDRALAFVPLTARGYLVLSEIQRSAPATQRDLARRLHLEPSTVCELLGRLRRAGLVERTGSGRRPRPPALTPRGDAALARATRVAARLERDWARRFGEGRAHGRSEPTFGTWPGPIFGLRRWITEGIAYLGPHDARRRR